MKTFDYALIMAAGRGMRMMPLTNDLPKAMAPYNGSTLIADGIERIKRHIANVYITVGYKGAMLAKHVIEHNVSGIFNTEGRDNAWWMFNTLLKYVDRPVVVLTCDNVIELDFALLAKEYTLRDEPACMVVPVRPVPGLEGDYVVHQKNVVTRLSRHEVTDLYCSGIQVVHPRKINAMMAQASNFYEVWRNLIARRALYCSDIYPRKWFAVDTMDQLASLQSGH